LVPFTAGSIISASHFGAAGGNGDAVWTTKSAPSIALSIETGSMRSASTSSN